jgi:Tfp pilus assembly protein PilF
MKKLHGSENLVPFNRTSGYIHLKAKENHKAGRYLEAAELYGCALESTNRAQIQYDLGLLYKDMGVYELAGRYLCRALALKPEMTEGFYELAVCSYFLQKREIAMEAAALYLKNDAIGLYEYEAHELIDWAAAPDNIKSSRRYERLIALAQRDAQAGRGELAAKRFMRVAGFRENDCTKLFEISLRLNMLKCEKEALRLARLAVKRFPNQAKAHCALSAALAEQGETQLAIQALDKLQGCEPRPGDDYVVFQTARFTGAITAAQNWFFSALEKCPYDTRALYILAYLAMQEGNPEQAEKYLQRILAVHGGDHLAVAAMRLIHLGKGREMPPPDGVTAESVQACVQEMLAFLSRPSGEITPEEKFWLDHFFALPIGHFCRELLDSIEANSPQRAPEFFKMWLVDEHVDEQVRNEIAYRLGRLSPGKMHLTLSLGRLAYTAMKPVTELEAANRRIFIKRFMVETRELKKNSEMATYAANCYDRLPREKKARAAGEEAYAYIAALKIRWLMAHEADVSAQIYIKDLLISRRRVERAMRVWKEIIREEE